jgi:hypothetical protein
MGGNGEAKKSRTEIVLQYTLKRIEPVNPLLFCFRHAYLVGGIGMGSSTPVQQAGLTGASKEARLEELKRLFYLKYLSKEAYSEMKKGILESP